MISRKQFKKEVSYFFNNNLRHIRIKNGYGQIVLTGQHNNGSEKCVTLHRCFLPEDGNRWQRKAESWLKEEIILYREKFSRDREDQEEILRRAQQRLRKMRA